MTLRENALTPPAPELRTLREARGMTQQDLARAVGRSPVAIHYWETGRQSPPYEALPALAAVFGMDYNALVPSVILTKRKAGL